ncbi:hypothetical protein VTK73DRAFT_6637 [Phialemonium thermophilum]|uniref:DH domain-containing protein n=1 Tax=Phialemonium thermophilum TaxID=223376 RepID=A0ABR3XW47_9PEZI
MDRGKHGEDIRLGAASFSFRLQSTQVPQTQYPQCRPDSPTHGSYDPYHPSDTHSRRLLQEPAYLDQSAFSTAAAHAGSSQQQPLTANDAVPTLNLLAASLDPDGFYRDYRGVDATNGLFSEPLTDAMASAIPSNRQTRSLRANSNGSTPKHPPANGPRPAFRSTSNPVDDRLQSPTVRNGYGGAPYQSVKDLKKKFDQTFTSPSSQLPPSQPSAGRKAAASRTRATRDGIATNPQARPNGTGSNSVPYSTVRSTTTTRDLVNSTSQGSSAARGTQRPKFVADDQISSNSQSFASRVSRPKNAVSSNAHASKSMTHLPPETSPLSDSGASTASARPNGLLFGEILPEDIDSLTPGFGIRRSTRPRRTSESHVPNPVKRPHLRSLSDPDVEPPSPTDWYRAALLPSHAAHAGSRIPRPNDAQSSDLPAGFSATTERMQYTSTTRQNHPQAHPTSPNSRLPRSVSRFNTQAPTTQSSPASTRSNSPSRVKRPMAGNGRNSRQGGQPPATRSKTPASHNPAPAAARAKTPTHSSGSARKVPAQINIPSNANNRLNAYVSVPPPKLSPTLRSSRPRQSVSTATTASSRMKAVESVNASQKKGSRAGGARPEETGSRRAKISVGPIDFAQRRETIKLAYSKSIRESQAREARQAAAERRKKELEAVAKAKAEAEAAAMAAIAANEDDERVAARPAPPAGPRNRSGSEDKLKVSTDLPPLETSVPHESSNTDLPTPDVPGSFPSIDSTPQEKDDNPVSAISLATAVTEFDEAAQTEPPIRNEDGQGEENPHDQLPAPARAQDLASVPLEQPPAEQGPPPPRKRLSYHYPFEDEEAEDDSVPLQVAVPYENDAKPPSPGPLHSRSEFQTEPVIPGSFRADLESPSNLSPSLPAYRTDTPATCSEVAFSVQGEVRIHAEGGPHHDEVQTRTTLSDTPAHVQHEPDDRTEPNAQNMDVPENFYVGPHMQDNVAALRESTLTSSDRDASVDGRPSIGEAERAPDTSHSLTVPAMVSPGNRLSAASAWTDFSFGSTDDREMSSRDLHYSDRSETDNRRVSSIRNIRTEPAIGLHDSSYEDIAESAVLSERDIAGVMAFLQQPSVDSEHQLPELDTGADFSVPYPPTKSQIGEVLPLPPDHAPPPPPPPEDSQLDEGATYIDTRPSSYLPSQDGESEDLTYPVSTPHSTAELSLDGPDSQAVPRVSNSSDVSGLAEKDKKRLKQRHLVLRELIETEATFVRDMSVVEEIYKGTAEACPKLDNKTVKLIFRNTDEIIAFHTAFLAQLKEAAASVYVPRGKRSTLPRQESSRESRHSDAPTASSIMSGDSSAVKSELDDSKDRQMSLGPVFSRNIDKMRTTHEGYLRTSDAATKRLIQIQEDDTVRLWLNECNEVAKDLTSAWNLDSLLIKPMQRITKYPNLISQLLEHTPSDHPDRDALIDARTAVENAILEINKTKKNFELVGQIVSRKRKDSDVRAGIARAFGKRVDKLQTSGNRPPEDKEFLELHEKFQDDYIHLQVVLRDVEYYTRTVATYVHEFLQYLSSMELVMRLQPSKHYGHLESKWVQFNVGMRDIEKVLEQHLLAVRKDVIEPFEQVIRSYGNPTLALKKRAKRRLDYEKFVQLKSSGKKVDKQLTELVEQYEALNETLKKELPKLSALTVKIGNICLARFITIQTKWYAVWKEKVKAPLADSSPVPELAEIVSAFQTDFRMVDEEVMSISLLSRNFRGRASQSTTDDASSTFSKSRSRPAELSLRGRGLSTTSDMVPSLPTPDILKRDNGSHITLPSPSQSYHRDYYSGINSYSRGDSSPVTSDAPASIRAAAASGPRPSTRRSSGSSSVARPSTESKAQSSIGNWRDSNSTYNLSLGATPGGAEQSRFSGLFHSALPLTDGPEETTRSSRASSRERKAVLTGGYNVLWLAASLFEFNIKTTKHEAGYPYLTYQAGEIFDVIAEKGELWLAKNQDDPGNQVGWIWSKHFAKLADS